MILFVLLFIAGGFWIAVLLLRHFFSFDSFAASQTTQLGRLGRSLGQSIHQLMLTNNGWWLIFASMAFLGVTIGTTIKVSHLSEHMKIRRWEQYQESPFAQKLYHQYHDKGETAREDTPQEKIQLQADLKNLRRLHSHWSWLSWGIGIGVFAILFSFYAFADEILEVVDELRCEVHGDQSASGPAAEGVWPAIIEWLRLRAMQSGQILTATTPAQPRPQQVPSFMTIFNIGLLGDLLAEVVKKAFSHWFGGRI